MNPGFLKLSRKTFQNFLWKENRAYSRFEAWLDLLQTANYAPSTHIDEGRCLSVHRGELVASVRYLAKRWSWSRGRVERYLAMLKKQTPPMIETRTETGISIISIYKYDTYNTNNPPSETPTRPTARQPRDKVEERKEREDPLSPPDPPAGGPEKESKIISLPTLEEWHRYASGKPGYQPAALASLYHYNAARGWQIGGRPIANWQALVDSKLAELAPAIKNPTTKTQLLPEPKSWQAEMKKRWPKSNPDKHSWADICKHFPDIAQTLAC